MWSQPAAPAQHHGPGSTTCTRALSRGALLFAPSELPHPRASRVSAAAVAAVGGGLLALSGATISRGMMLVSLPTQIVGGSGSGSGGRGSGVLLWAAPTRGSGAVTGGANRAARQPTVVVVESPTKAKKIQGFLGDQYKVLASYGHVRDLPSRDGSVRPEQDFALEWQLLAAAGPRLEEIAGAAAGAPALILATDPDREGEAISWHIEEELRRRGVLKRMGAVHRITFTEITRSAITAALSGARKVSQPLVDAYLARRALDYLVGFHLSPVLWRKLPGAKSAGRVQSVALRLVCEREAAVERFTPTPYWSVAVHLATNGSGVRSDAAAAAGAGVVAVGARLTHVDGRRLGPLDIGSAELAEELAGRIVSGPAVVSRVTSRTLQRHPAAPFTTASLQQEASRRLGFGAAKTMRLAQQLYEGAGTGEGLITYMRTDGVTMSAEAVEELRTANGAMYGKDAVPPQPRQYKSRAKNAQEAHEAIRPTRPASVTPASLPASLDYDLRALYELIWRRAVASQMASAVYDVVTVEFSADGGSLTLRASGSLLRQPGFLRAYEDLTGADSDEEPAQQQSAQRAEGGAGGTEDEAALAGALERDQDNRGAAAEMLLALKVGTSLRPSGPVVPSQHWTRPPPRFTEASLVWALEERGIGRPSTYAPIMSLLQDRGYVLREGRSLLPTSLGRVLTAFLEHYFPSYVDYDFTSHLEGQLDEVADGRAAWRAVLSDFWGPFNATVAAMTAIRTAQVYDMLDSALDSYFFRPHPGATPLLLPSSTTPIPTPTPTRPTSPDAPASGGEPAPAAAAAAAVATAAHPRLCPKCGRGRLVLKPSRYGGFIGCSLFADEATQCDYARPLLRLAAGGVGGELLPGASGTDLDGDGSDGAAAANATERLLGSHPETGQPVWVRLGPYGLYVQLGDAAPKAKKGTKAKKGKKAAAAAAGKKKGRKASKAATAEAGTESEAEGAEEEEEEGAAAKPKRAAIPKAPGVTLQSVTLPQALGLLALPRTLGPHPDDGLPVVANTGPFGPYVAHDGLSASLGRWASPQDVDMATAVQLLAAKRARQEARVARGLPPTRGGRGRGRSAAASGKGTEKGKGPGADPPDTGAMGEVGPGSKGAGGVRVTKAAAKAVGNKAGKKPAASAPPKAKSAYTLFLQQRWQEIKDAEGGEVPYREAVSRIAAEWRALGDDGQRQFGETAADAASACTSTAARATPPQTAAAARRTATAAAATAAAPTAVVVAAAPSRSNPYIRFCQQRRPELRSSHPGASLGELSRMLGAEWGALSEAHKAAYR